MLDAVEQVKGIFLITADHGNAEDMVKRNLKSGAPVKNKKGETEVLTSHTCNPVSARFLPPHALCLKNGAHTRIVEIIGCRIHQFPVINFSLGCLGKYITSGDYIIGHRGVNLRLKYGN